MIGGRPWGVRRCAFFLALAGVAGTTTRGAEDSPAGSNAPAGESSIANAKRDFESIKAAREPMLQPKPDFPRMGMPEMRAGPPEPRWTQPRAVGPEQKESNWLVEAMEKKNESRNERERPTPERDRTERGIESREKSTADRLDERGDRDANDKKGEKPATVAVNPFSKFLSSWMTPQDLALLQPSLTQTASSQIDTRLNSPTGSTSSAMGSSLAANAVFGLVSNTQPVQPPSVPRENPYLSGFNATAVGAGSSPPIQPAASAQSLTPATNIPLSAAPPPTSPTRSVVPDFVRPTSDEKYFKQLKRF